MSGAHQGVFMNQRRFGPPPPGAIGSAYEGGFYAGDISTTANSVATHHLVVGPRSTAQSQLRWKTTNTATSGADSAIDGPSNTADMISAGAAAHPCAQFCNNLSIGGFTDWYMPAVNEQQVCYFNFKPTTQNNNTTQRTANPNAVPAKGPNTTGNPARTSLSAFQFSAGAQSYTNAFYWSSSQGLGGFRTQRGRYNSFISGNVDTFLFKDSSLRVRAIRRLAL